MSLHMERIFKHVREKKFISRNMAKEAHEGVTLGQRAADKVARFGGSWIFIITSLTMLVLWVAMNTYVLVRWDSHFDPYPYILLNLVLSMMAAIQAPIIMMSQNRQAEKDRAEAAHDYEVNLKAEIEIRELHDKLDQLLHAHNISLPPPSHP